MSRLATCALSEDHHFQHARLYSGALVVNVEMKEGNPRTPMLANRFALTVVLSHFSSLTPAVSGVAEREVFFVRFLLLFSPLFVYTCIARRATIQFEWFLCSSGSCARELLRNGHSIPRFSCQ